MKIILLKRLPPFLTMEMKNHFYNAYILPHFDYYCVVWTNGTKSYLNKLFAIQKRTARLVLMKPNRTPSLPLFNTLRWLTFNNIYKYHTGVLVYKAINNQAPSYISDLLVNAPSHKYSLRSSIRGDIISTTKSANTNILLNTFLSKVKKFGITCRFKYVILPPLNHLNICIKNIFYELKLDLSDNPIIYITFQLLFL